MFEVKGYKRTLPGAPQSVTALVAAFLEPLITVLVYVATSAVFGDPIQRPDLTLCVLVFALTFPGRNRFGDQPLDAAVDIGASWLGLLVILALCGHATGSLHFFSPAVLAWWALVTPVLRWLACFQVRKALHQLASRPGNRRTAVVVGAGALGVKVARAFQARGDIGVSFLGFFDDRADRRVHDDAALQRLGNLRQLAPCIREHGVHEVYITLPLGSQPRIVELLEELKGTAASVFFVPDAFGVSIIQGRLQDMSGVPVVQLFKTPLSGIHRLVKRLSDLGFLGRRPC